MTTPPLDLPALRAIANAATQSEWTSYGYRVETVPALDLHRFDVMAEMVAECDLIEEDARHIAAFDPPTVLALIDRVEKSERACQTLGRIIERDGEAILQATGAHYLLWGDDGDGDWEEIHGRLQELGERARTAEAQVAKVRELHTKEKHGVQNHCGECLQDDSTGSWEYVEWPCLTINALDGTP